MRLLFWLGACLLTAAAASPTVAGAATVAPPTTPVPAQLASPSAHPAAPRTTRPAYRKVARAISASAVVSGPTVPGSVAKILPSGLAAAPSAAPHSVKVMIWTTNRLIGLRYRYGGGHASFSDSAYDCSGSVSYALHAAGMLSYPEDSTGLESWGRKGSARWVTVYTNSGHAWMIVAGIRLDTSPVADPSGLNGPRWRPADRPTAGFQVRHAGGEKTGKPITAPVPPPPNPLTQPPTTQLPTPAIPAPSVTAPGVTPPTPGVDPTGPTSDPSAGDSTDSTDNGQPWDNGSTDGSGNPDGSDSGYGGPGHWHDGSGAGYPGG